MTRFAASPEDGTTLCFLPTRTRPGFDLAIGSCRHGQRSILLLQAKAHEFNSSLRFVADSTEVEMSSDRPLRGSIVDNAEIRMTLSKCISGAKAFFDNNWTVSIVIVATKGCNEHLQSVRPAAHDARKAALTELLERTVIFNRGVTRCVLGPSITLLLELAQGIGLAADRPSAHENDVA